MIQPTFEMAAGGTHLIPQDPIVWPSDAKLRLVFGGPPDLLPTRVAVLPPGCHYRIAQARTQMHHRNK